MGAKVFPKASWDSKTKGLHNDKFIDFPTYKPISQIINENEWNFQYESVYFKNPNSKNSCRNSAII